MATLCKGAILYHKDFAFPDGGVSDKLFVLLNNPSKFQPYLFCKTTSKPKFNITKMGCYSDKNIYYVDAHRDWFKLNTWIQFHELYQLNAAELLDAHCKGRIVIQNNLKEPLINGLINCIKKSDDISSYHLSLLS